MVGGVFRVGVFRGFHGVGGSLEWGSIGWESLWGVL